MDIKTISKLISEASEESWKIATYPYKLFGKVILQLSLKAYDGLLTVADKFKEVKAKHNK